MGVVTFMDIHGLHYIFIHANISGLLTIDVKDVLVSGEETRRVIHLEPICFVSFNQCD